MSEFFLIAGLGNPGSQYKNNRHNVGFNAVDKLVHRFNFSNYVNKFQSEFFLANQNGLKIAFAKPQTYMNLSGKAISALVNFYKIALDNVFIIHDDLDLPIGEVRIKKGGGSGGHNGLKSIDAYIGKDYYRIRIGIGHPGRKEIVSSYVLSNFNKNDEEVIDGTLQCLAENYDDILKHDILGFLNKIKSTK